ncbi:MAG: serine/threonine-protein phosphatase [Schwartzia sp.]|nr:serine/threonine-protein phosphatase [Schwartzia sp. (in: firmicutes)]
MEIKIGIARANKYEFSSCGDCCDIVERPTGGVSVVMVDGQGNGAPAHSIASFVIGKARSLIEGGTRDDDVARSVHEALYDLSDRRMAAELTIVGVDCEAESIIVSRNTSAPVIICAEEYEAVYDDEAGAIGVNRHVNPLICEIPYEANMIAVAYTDGIRLAGKKRGGRRIDTQKIVSIVRDNSVDDVDFIARSIIDLALEMDGGEAADDMTVVVLGLKETADEGARIDSLSASYSI